MRKARFVRMRGRAVASVTGLLAILSMLAPAATALEIDILEEYLSGYDRIEGLVHCGRHDGYVMVPDQPPQTTPAGGTNEIMVEHKKWHLDHGATPTYVPPADDADRFGDHFVYWHREYVAAYEAWRAENGHPVLVGVDPAKPIPADFAYEFPGRGCVPGRGDPEVMLPTWATVEGGTDEDPVFGYTRLCDFQDVNQFGKAIGSRYHASVHAAIGGDMGTGQGPRDPVFWGFHRYLDDVALGFEVICSEATTEGDLAGSPTAQSTPGVAAPVLFAFIAAALAGTRRRR